MSPDGTFLEDLPAKFSRRLNRPLPGRDAHREMEPELSYGRHSAPPSYGARHAAVVIPLFWDDDRWHLLLTVRSPHVIDHAGQICLPGGAVECGESSQDAALRELAEEIGITTGDVQVVGRLSTVYVFSSNFLVVPWVAFAGHRPTLRPNPLEVSGVLELPLAELVQPQSRSWHEIAQGELIYRAPNFVWQGHRIWGGTALVLGELVAILRDLSGPSGKPAAS